MGTVTPDSVGALAARDQVGKLLKAANDGDLTNFKALATLIADGQELGLSLSHVKDGNDRGPLHFAALGGKTDICKYMVEELKLPIDPVDGEGETPLILATRLGFSSTAQYLLDQGADAHAQSEDSQTSAMHHAAGVGSLELITSLLEKGVDPDLPSNSGTPLIWAAGHGRAEAVELLIKRGANPNVTADDDVTPLLTAVAAEFPEVVDVLLKNGADVNCAATGVTPLHIAAEQGHEEIVNLLLDGGANPNLTDDDHTTPIQAACRGRQRAIVERLLPLTTPLRKVPEWTVDGLMSCADLLVVDDFLVKTREVQKQPVEKEKAVEVPSERKQKALEAKARGTLAFKRGDFMDAVDEYTQAHDLDPTNADVLSNRSLCWMRLGQAEQALVDAQATRELAPQWVKAHYREGSALRLLQRFDEAANAFYSGVKIDPENKVLIDAFKEAVAAGKKFHGVSDEGRQEGKQEGKE